MIRVLAFGRFPVLGRRCVRVRWLEKKSIASDHIIDNATLADFLALELRLGRQVVTIIVTEMVVRCDRERLDTRVNEELGEDRLQLRLARLEIVTADEGLLLLRELDNTRNEGVLRSAVDEGHALKNGCDCEDGRGRYLGVRSLDGREQVVRGIIDTRDDVAVALGVRRPEHDDLIKAVLLLERTDVSADVLDMSMLICARNNVVRTRLLVGGDVVRVVDGRHRRAKRSHIRGDLALEVPIEDLSTRHRLVHRKAGDVPASENEVIRVNHR